MKAIPDEKRDEIDRLLGLGVDKTEISRRVGCCRNTVIDQAKKRLADAIEEVDREESRRVGEAHQEKAKDETDPQRTDFQFREKGDDASVSINVRQPIKTLDELIAACEIDTAIWRVDSWECTAWNSVTKDKSKEAHLHQLFRVHAKLKRIMPKAHEDATKAIFERMSAIAPIYLHPAIKVSPSPYLAEIDLFDCHFANLSWAPECRENDDLRLKEAVFANAIDDLLGKTAGYPVTEVVFPLGNDLHHVDTLSQTTTAGTPQDCDGRYAKMIEITEVSVINGIERILAVPTVQRIDVIYVPGNHDRVSTLHLCRTVSAWFRNNERVRVELEPSTRKYRLYGRCLFGYVHGDNTPDNQMGSLPAIMAVEEPEKWGRTMCREWKLGHTHTSKTFTTLTSREQNGVMMRRLRALSAVNRWHFDKGYIGNSRAAEIYLYHRDAGFEGQFIANARV